MHCKRPKCRDLTHAGGDLCRRHQAEEARRQLLLAQIRADRSPPWDWPCLATFEAGPGLCRLGVSADPIRRREDMLPGCPWDIRIGLAVMGPRPVLDLLALELAIRLPLIAPPFDGLRPGWYPLESAEVEDAAIGVREDYAQRVELDVRHPKAMRAELELDPRHAQQARLSRLLELLAESGH